MFKFEPDVLQKLNVP